MLSAGPLCLKRATNGFQRKDVKTVLYKETMLRNLIWMTLPSSTQLGRRVSAKKANLYDAKDGDFEQRKKRRGSRCAKQQWTKFEEIIMKTLFDSYITGEKRQIINYTNTRLLSDASSCDF